MTATSEPQGNASMFRDTSNRLGTVLDVVKLVEQRREVLATDAALI